MNEVTRRHLLKMGLLGGAGLVLPLGVLQIPLASIRETNAMKSPPVKPFQVPLPILPVLQPVRTDSTTDYYEITQKPGVAHILPGHTTPIWGYNGLFPGPTIEARSGRTTIVRQTNELPVPISTHLHGGHTPPESDGDPNELIWPVHGSAVPMPETSLALGSVGMTVHMGSKNYIYPNNQRGATLWYHDHRMGFTGPQVYRGLAGFYILRDDAEDRLPLPKGDHEIPLLITDRIFNADGSFYYPSIDSSLTRDPGAIGTFADGVYGDTILVNGAVQPFFEVSNTKYRFRILLATNASRYRLRLNSGHPFTQIGSDGGLLAAPVRQPHFTMAPAERFDTIIDFSPYPIGTQIVLESLPEDLNTIQQIMRFDVVRKEKDESSIPAKLSPYEILDPASATVTRQFHFERSLGMWTINGKRFDPSRADAQPRLNATEIWEFTADEHHPIHIHDIMFQILSHNGKPSSEDVGMKDTFLLNGGQKGSIITKFTDNPGPYVFHCHNLEHEDMSMMGRFIVV
ncbi:MAG TPA: multicopper oxidase family protein [Ktedonobacteraceae bacterium]|nr:multicopper oxidase family protein [Ktedonobacteraceae bacterium]